MSDAAEPNSGHTRDRLLAAGLRLFAERGFSAVGVGEIEQAVGLVPRRGALYRHFASKDQLLEAAVRGHLDSVAAARAQFVLSVTGDVRADALELAQWVMGELDTQHAITRVLEREGDRLPTLRDTFRRDVSDPGYVAMADILRGWLQACGRDTPIADLQELAVHLLGALVNARRSAWTLGQPPPGMDDDRIAHSWADLCVFVVNGYS